MPPDQDENGEPHIYVRERRKAEFEGDHFKCEFSRSPKHSRPADEFKHSPADSEKARIRCSLWLARLDQRAVRRRGKERPQDCFICGSFVMHWTGRLCSSRPDAS